MPDFADLESNPYFSTAHGEIAGILREIPEDAYLPKEAIQQLMTIAWLRGASWKETECGRN